jgi:hypothetical protein
VAFIETAFEFLSLIVTKGLTAAWEKFLEFIGDLKEMVLGAIRDWVAGSIIKKAITKLVSMFNPVGAIIQAITMTYDAITFFIERAKQVGELAEAVFDSVANIATGNLGAAANYVEKTMARTIPVIIGFLASLIGLGGIGEKIKKIIEGIHAKVEKALDKIVNFIVTKAKALFGKEKEAPETTDPEHDAKVKAGLAAIDEEEKHYLKDGMIEKEDAEKVAAKVKSEHPIFKSITVVEGEDTWDYDYVANPGRKIGPIRTREDLVRVIEDAVDRGVKVADYKLKGNSFWAQVYQGKVMPESLKKYPAHLVKAVIRGTMIHRVTEEIVRQMNIPGLHIEKRIIVDYKTGKYRRPDFLFKVSKKDFRLALDIKPRNYNFGPGDAQYDDIARVVMDEWGGEIKKLEY